MSKVEEGATLQAVESTLPPTTQVPLVNSSNHGLQRELTTTHDNDTIELRQQLCLAELNNGLLQTNVNTLKAVAHQLAAQLDLANDQIRMYEEKSETEKIMEEQKQIDLEGTKSDSNNNEYEERLEELRAALKEKDKCLAALRYEIIQRDNEANTLMRSLKQERDKTVSRLMSELDELRRVMSIDKCYRAKRW